MEQKLWTISLPEPLFELVQKAAMQNDQSLETVIVNSLTVLFGAIPDDPNEMLTTLQEFTDDQLWAIIYQRMPQSEESRLDELGAKGKRGELSAVEQAELDKLLYRVNTYTLLRTQVLVLLQERGYDVEERFHLKV